MIGFIILGLASVSLLASGQEYAQERSSRGYSYDDEVEYEKPTAAPVTPVPILKQINTRNDDGSYTFGFEAADGSFKIETKEANGEVRGKYGYTDESGKLHVVEYGANKFGFQPSGEGITVPPLNLVAEPEEEELEQRVYKQPRPRPQEARAPAPAPAPRRAPAPQPPHIQYAAPASAAAAPVPKRPQFFAGAEPVRVESYDYDQPAPAPARPVQNIPRPAPRPQPVQYQPQPKPAPQVKYTQTERPVANFIPAPTFRQFNLPQYRNPEPQYEPASEPPQYFRQDPVRPQPGRFTQVQLPEEEPRSSYSPRPAPKAQLSGGFFDQLQQQYSLPKNSGQPVHDVSFGFY